MTKDLISLLLPVVVALPVGLFIILRVFKGSILSFITTMWLITIIGIMTTTNLKHVYPKTFHPVLTLILGTALALVCIYFVQRKIRKPLKEIVESLQQLAKGTKNGPATLLGTPRVPTGFARTVEPDVGTHLDLVVSGGLLLALSLIPL